MTDEHRGEYQGNLCLAGHRVPVESNKTDNTYADEKYTYGIYHYKQCSRGLGGDIFKLVFL